MRAVFLRSRLFRHIAELLALAAGLLASFPATAGDVATAEIPYDEEAQTELVVLPYTGPRIVINAAARKLKLYDGDKLVKTFPIAVGSARYRTPIGDREMSQIVWNPWWIPPKDSAWAKDAKDTPPGPRNPLGPVKMKLGDAIMVHGTNNPKSVGHAASHGCMRMLSDEALELARHIQERVMGVTDQAVYDEYKRNNRRSYYVNFTQNVPVSIIYDVAEVEDGQLFVYQDIYWRGGDKLAAVKEDLALKGYNLDEFDLDFLGREIKSAKGKDLSFSIADLLLANRKAPGLNDATVSTATADTAWE